MRKTLTPEEEVEYLAWKNHIEKLLGLGDLSDPRHNYSYRDAFKAGVRRPDETGHWPSKFKTPLHPNLIINGRDTRFE